MNEEQKPIKDEAEAVEPLFAELIEKVEKMTVVELNRFVKSLESHFGVSAASIASPAAGSVASAESEKTEFSVELAESGPQKIQVIKVVKEALGLGLKEAKDLVESAPAILKEGLPKEDAEKLKQAIEGAGGKAVLK